MVFEPNGPGPDDMMAKAKKVPNMTPGCTVLISLVEKYLAGLLDPSISLLEVHKLMYFAQEAGEPLHLRYVKAHHGPHAENLWHVLEGYMLSGYRDGSDAPDKAFELVPGVAEDARAS